MTYYFDIENGYIQLSNILKNLLNIYKISFNKKIEKFVDIRSINFTEIQDEFLTENLIKLKNIINEFLENVDEIKDQVLINNLKTIKDQMSKIRSNHNYAYYFIKLYWSIQHLLMREKILSDENYDNNIVNYNWILCDELLAFLELLIDKKNLQLSSNEYACLNEKYKDTLLAQNLISIDHNEIRPTTLAKKLIESIEISELFNYYQYDFDEIIEL